MGGGLAKLGSFSAPTIQRESVDSMEFLFKTVEFDVGMGHTDAERETGWEYRGCQRTPDTVGKLDGWS